MASPPFLLLSRCVGCGVLKLLLNTRRRLSSGPSLRKHSFCGDLLLLQELPKSMVIIRNVRLPSVTHQRFFLILLKSSITPASSELESGI